MSRIAGATTFQITSTKLYIQIVTLSTKDNVNLLKQLDEGFKRPLLQDLFLMLLFKELTDCLFLLLLILMVMPIKLKETVNKNTFFQE